ncbi:hypothetical protein PIB30_062887 [Stylosanthes scabra]|uniref:Uncharacterized protein n=1 Tax=Stylosanthes scabra TaxID=79078 RepID=A0ABU6XMN1_9FABA|nr:hypothetical protein [Stylosanthes scabra]
MARTKSNPLAKEKTRVPKPSLRSSPRLVALRSREEVQPQLQAPDRIATLNRAKSQTSEEQEVIVLSRDSEHKEDGHLEADVEGALPAAEGGAEEILPKNDVYDALWAMLDAESENEAKEIPGQWDFDNVLNNWGRVEPNTGPAGDNQGPPPAAN